MRYYTWGDRAIYYNTELIPRENELPYSSVTCSNSLVPSDETIYQEKYGMRGNSKSVETYRNVIYFVGEKINIVKVRLLEVNFTYSYNIMFLNSFSLQS